MRKYVGARSCWPRQNPSPYSASASPPLLSQENKSSSWYSDAANSSCAVISSWRLKKSVYTEILHSPFGEAAVFCGIFFFYTLLINSCTSPHQRNIFFFYYMPGFFCTGSWRLLMFCCINWTIGTWVDILNVQGRCPEKNQKASINGNSNSPTCLFQL